MEGRSLRQPSTPPPHGTDAYIVTCFNKVVMNARVKTHNRSVEITLDPATPRLALALCTCKSDCVVTIDRCANRTMSDVVRQAHRVPGALRHRPGAEAAAAFIPPRRLRARVLIASPMSYSIGRADALFSVFKARPWSRGTSTFLSICRFFEPFERWMLYLTKRSDCLGQFITKIFDVRLRRV